MSSREFAEWLAYYDIEPFGEERADLRSAIVACVFANAHRDPKKQSSPFKVEDFMPKFRQDTTPDWQSQLHVVEMLNAIFGGEDKR